MKKQLIAVLFSFVLMGTAAAQEWNFGGQWEWHDPGIQAQNANVYSYLTLYGGTQVGSTVLGRYCGDENDCYEITATEHPGDYMSFVLGPTSGYFEFFLNKETGTLDGNFWFDQNHPDFPDARISMSPLG